MRTAAGAIAAFQQNLSEIDDEITTLSTIRAVIKAVIDRLNIAGNRRQLLEDENILELVDALTASKINFKEEKTMDELKKASEKRSRLTDRDVRIVYLPPATVASVHLIGSRDPEAKDGEAGFYPEDRTAELLRRFINNVNLPGIKPDFRIYGFNHPNGSNNGGPSEDHGYERWVTIPDDLEVEPPFEKRYYKGGMYAAHAIGMGAFEEWGWLWQWVSESEQYVFVPGDPECMDGLLEEELNAFVHYTKPQFDGSEVQLDLLVPIKEK